MKYLKETAFIAIGIIMAFCYINFAFLWNRVTAVENTQAQIVKYLQQAQQKQPKQKIRKKPVPKNLLVKEDK